MKEISNEVPRKLAVNSNYSLVICIKEHIKSLQNEIYFLREAIQQKNAFISIMLQYIYIYIYIYIYQHAFPNSSKHEDHLPDQKAIAKHETNTAEL